MTLLNIRTVNVLQNSMLIDYDYTRKMERLNLTSHDLGSDKTTQLIIWNDFNNVSSLETELKGK